MENDVTDMNTWQSTRHPSQRYQAKDAYEVVAKKATDLATYAQWPKIDDKQGYQKDV